MTTQDSAHEPGNKLYFMVFGALLAIVAIEVFFTYQGLSTGTLLTAVLVLAIIEATLGVMYFMHMRYERSILFWSLIPYLVVCFIMMNHIWRDASRVIALKVQSP